MRTCFVIQPFDKGKFDKRYEDVLSPAIAMAELEPYRVDRDPEVEVPIESIEKGIRDAAICLADISTDNPNVWYELGFAYASRKPVIMICSEEQRIHFPFDIQHRNVIKYKSESTSDFEVLKHSISVRLKSMLEKRDLLEQQSEEQLAPVEGLTPIEIAVLAVIVGNVLVPSASVPIYAARRELENVGYTSVGFSIGLRKLSRRCFVKTESTSDQNGEEYEIIYVQTDGWEWIERNEQLFVLQHKHDRPPLNEIPF